MQNIQLTEHFSLDELTVTTTGLDNTPSDYEVVLLRTLAIFLEKVRAILGGDPVIVGSAFRSPAVNAEVGGVPDDAHMKCFGADIIAPMFGSPYEIAKALDKAQVDGKIEFDQLIYEGTWVHISRDPQLRSERLTLLPNGGYEKDIVGP